MIITLPLYIFLFLYFVVLTMFSVFMVINFYHIVGSGTLTFASFLFTFLTAVITMVILYETYILLQGTDWQQTITMFDISWITNLFPSATF